MPRLYLFTILRRSVGFWLILRLALALLVGLWLLGQGLPLNLGGLVFPTAETVLALTGIVALMITLDLRTAREHILLGNFGMPSWVPALVAGALVFGMELGVHVVHVQLLPQT